MPPKSINKAASKASKDKTTPPKAKKAKTTPKKQPAKGKAPPKTPMPSLEPEETSSTPPHSLFVYSLSDPQEKLFNFNCHSDPTSEPEDEDEQEPEPGTPADEPIDLWDLNSIHNVCNQNGTFAVPTTYPVVRNIPDNTVVQANILCTINCKKQNKKWQQFPLIGETAAGSWGNKTRIKNNNFNLDRFYTPSAGRAAGCQASNPSLPASPRLPTTASQSHTQAVKWGNCQKGKPKNAISPNPNGGGTAAQIWNLPNLGGADKLLKPSIPALTAEVKIGCMKASNDTPSQFKPRDNNPLPVHHYQFPSQKIIPDNTKCLGFSIQCFTLFMPPQG
ncbi:hypothetical protein DSO57_1005127 [Entomophthora muscae]|uniref:Uncharacterized protein n=1 Tax=Entomophthora muscae TaxID=34485 RepID=A0ACC2RZ54_9FUNG|nr:hypothetical protein DSO57_1005127 [Entomophthora muscae]